MTSDPQNAGLAYLIQSNDARMRTDFWDLARAMSENDVKVYSASGQTKESVLSGENILALNLVGSYALEWAKANPNLGVHFASDYTPAFMRLVLVTKDAPHPHAGRLFLEYLLSQEGQSKLAAKGLPSVRSDVTSGLNRDTLNQQVGGGLTPIQMDDDALSYMEPEARVKFITDWKAALNR